LDDRGAVKFLGFAYFFAVVLSLLAVGLVAENVGFIPFIVSFSLFVLLLSFLICRSKVQARRIERDMVV
jgi:ammonia channel protein AmtB